MAYSYRKRPIGSCIPRRSLRAAEVGQNVANSIALYERPKLIHVGPEVMRQGESEEGDPHPYKWVRLDTASGVPDTLDRADVWLQHPKGSLDVLFDLIGCTYAHNIGEVDAATRCSFAPVSITATLFQYVAGSDTPAALATTTLNTTIRCFPVNAKPASRYPILTMLEWGWRPAAPGLAYNKDEQQVRAGARYAQLYPVDFAILQRVRLTLDYGDLGWSPDFATRADNPAFVEIKCIKTAGKDVL
jgi:hypothetical protein